MTRQIGTVFTVKPTPSKDERTFFRIGSIRMYIEKTNENERNNIRRQSQRMVSGFSMQRRIDSVYNRSRY